ncbi:maleylpyruvate isomerase family mycothiol-dependent enzyme [Streptomyces lunaelactis]|uniref:maleylpyruvate isomerase family mycothiol-dependent enzyme n=1 Tax=Streptomyces lunaelactis TaxID=1535768 RepID=UPI0015854F27|nr:maleylpyruvate isomerase family mycothiol-dependent enzyme [Streptomyces lunaelactis]NUK02293.1 maleylpyruvate isomerase family mycothiol-dependent enzyme [Streptomyces lunaelactis]NUK09029.1 maleylpyruvate isomerase family mycothiol-dependent enzyme [Streptomyces lunaelactis]NUK15857.1 maleylpyruvate isomerase family mycothiol-dependent enzyme [Streptomyces lunaelactis]NUK35013.1 maleylpyruvate isomerase family mycothiol-dependent enzyme [Streptomyces lunaelactis]NUK41853.1 maleylpyruvate 
MIDPLRDLDSVREATERLLAAAAGLDEAATAEPSRLPGWSRGHVLAHISRNAEALVNVLEGRPMYTSGEAREADIERDAPRPLADQLADVRATAARFQAAGAVPADWSRTVELRNGITDAAARVPFRRLIEVELHHVDLGIGYDLEDLPKEFAEREIAFLAQRFSGRPDVPPTRIVADTGEWGTGGGEGDPVTVSGTAPALLGWLAGRRDGAALNTAGAPLPALPPL